MLIICPSCATSYEVQPNTLPPHGQVRCLRCQTVWSPQLYQADKLLAAAAAIAADFGFRDEAGPSEEGAPQAEPSADIVASDSLSQPCTVDMGLSLAAESAAAEPEPDHSLVVAESATAHLLPAPSIFAEVVTPDSRLDHDPTCENHGRLDLDVAPMPLVPSNEQLQRLVSETLPAEQTLGMLRDGEWLPANLFAEADESSAGHAADVLEEEPSPDFGYLTVMSEDARGAALQSVEKCSVDMICVKLEAALSEQVEIGARERPLDLRADYYDNRFSENAENIERRTGSRSRRKAKVQERSLNIPKRRFIPRWPLSNLHSGIVALALLDMFLVGWRTDIVRKLPQTASFYALTGLPVNLRGLAFENITTNSLRDNGTPVLVVEGNVVNDTRKNLRVPEIRFVVRDAAAQEIYSWTESAARTSLPPGQAATFRARLASPPPGAHDLVLRFVSRRDAIAVIR
jgi:predicted Zn finger-like uncharacterized protein